MHKLKKQPAETSVGVGIDFSRRLATGEILSTGTITASVVSGSGAVVGDITISGKTINNTSMIGTIAGGKDGCVYKLTYLVTGTVGNILESEIKLTVKDT